MKELYPNHLRTLRERLAEVLASTGYDALVLHSGTPFTYFADDQDAPFRSTPAFAHWLPLRGPHHLLLLAPNEKPYLIMVTPEDFWFDHAREQDPYWASEFTVHEVATPDAAWELLQKELRGHKAAFVGDATKTAQEHGLDGNPENIVTKLHEMRTCKTPYEVACIEAANAQAALGHQHAHEAFLTGASELELHHAFLAGAQTYDGALPYAAITALDEKSAVLHYEGKRAHKNGKVFLLDAGAKIFGYDSDITRTWTTPSCDARFVSMIAALDTLEQSLAARVGPGVSTLALHKTAHEGVAQILREHHIITANDGTAIDEKITSTFFPHGLGHFLGIQTHDVGAPDPVLEAHPERTRFPKLRSLRTLEQGNIITIEPGIYFIPILLNKLRVLPGAKFVNWTIVDELTPCGGIRIEDDVLVTEGGNKNLTRPFVL